MSTAPGSSDDSKIRVRRAPLGQVWEAANALAAGQMPKQLSGSTSHSDILVESSNCRLQLADPFARPIGRS